MGRKERNGKEEIKRKTWVEERGRKKKVEERGGGEGGRERGEREEDVQHIVYLPLLWRKRERAPQHHAQLLRTRCQGILSHTPYTRTHTNKIKLARQNLTHATPHKDAS